MGDWTHNLCIWDNAVPRATWPGPSSCYFHWQGECFVLCYSTAGFHKWNIAKRHIWLLGLRECRDDIPARLPLESVGWGFLVGFLTMLSCHWPWPAVLTVEKAILCLFSQTGRIMLITPLRTKALDLLTMLTSLSCPITHVTGALSFSLPELAAFHTGRKTPKSFCAQDYEACSYWKDTSFDVSCQNETEIYFVNEEENWKIKCNHKILS